ncbi:hypothetical protein [Kutzneria buriramensis]|uniref:Uncharacterized protein n=1 Tax=Kutzneria buriramensis TaxID=1045776 RepID=A0A3E0HCT0_9PSEU|nr:hypothetical protein [Kutzneria buriramensis]REH41789.1 hypothetical protein BCF44_11191 [Kutzneria buriramensis]
MLHALTGGSAARTAWRSGFTGLAAILVAGACSQPSAPVAPAAETTAAAPADTAVLTQRGDPTRVGWNRHETVLTQATVADGRFGQRIAYPLDGAVYAQPLFVPGLHGHNAAIVATEHGSVYALDADAKGAARAPLWQRSLLPAGAKPVSASDDVKCESISPEVGVTGTPVIDPATNTLYVVATMHGQAGIVDRMYALDVSTGKDKLSPVTLSAAVAGSNSSNGKVRFDAAFEQQRVGLLLQDGVVYAAFSSYCSRMPYEGWILGYQAKDLRQAVVYTDNPDQGSSGRRPGGGGIWQSQTGLVGYQGSIFVTTGNGPYNLNQPGGRNAGMSLLRLVRDGGTLRVADAFTPFNVTCLNDHDQDLSSGAPLLLTGQGEVLEISKEGRIEVTKIDSLGGFHTIDAPCGHQDRTDVDQIVQELPIQTVAGGVWGAETTWTGGGRTYVYTAGVADKLTAWQLVDGKIVEPAASQAPEGLSYPGGIPVVSSNGDQPGTAVVWIVGNQAGGPVLRAYDPTDLRRELVHEKLTGYTNFTVPTVADGRVVVGTQQSVLIYGPL